MLLEKDQELVDLMALQLGRFITAKEPNTRRVGVMPLVPTALTPRWL